MKKRIKVEDLLQYWGTPFIEILYHIAFDTYPDEGGLQYYRAKLDNGVERIKIIKQITSASNSKVAFEDIDGAKQLLAKVQKRESLRKKFRPLKPIYLFMTSLEKKFFVNERILLNSTYEINHFLRHNPSLSSQQLTPSLLPSLHLSDNFDNLSESEKILYSQISKQLFS